MTQFKNYTAEKMFEAYMSVDRLAKNAAYINSKRSELSKINNHLDALKEYYAMDSEVRQALLNRFDLTHSDFDVFLKMLRSGLL